MFSFSATPIDGELKGKTAVTTVDVVIGRDSRGCCSERKATQTIDEVKEIMAGGLTPVQPSELLTAT